MSSFDKRNNSINRYIRKDIFRCHIMTKINRQEEQLDGIDRSSTLRVAPSSVSMSVSDINDQVVTATSQLLLFVQS